MIWIYAAVLGWVTAAVVYFLAWNILPARWPKVVAAGMALLAVAILEAVLLGLG